MILSITDIESTIGMQISIDIKSEAKTNWAATQTQTLGFFLQK